MSLSILTAIALLCQVSGTYGSKSVAMSGGSYRDDKTVEMEFSYDDASSRQLKCQKYYIKCIQNNKNLDECVLERK